MLGLVWHMQCISSNNIGTHLSLFILHPRSSERSFVMPLLWNFSPSINSIDQVNYILSLSFCAAQQSHGYCVVCLEMEH